MQPHGTLQVLIFFIKHAFEIPPCSGQAIINQALNICQSDYCELTPDIFESKWKIFSFIEAFGNVTYDQAIIDSNTVFPLKYAQGSIGFKVRFGLVLGWFIWNTHINYDCFAGTGWFSHCQWSNTQDYG